ncbi:MAG: hypothetical protein KVP17_004759 [Porospora cf. gigantea B]|uniref:uncharacterized protein n=2 Tax=Porospora cf. gigantea B TaxID=2853592 RepID=UPI003571B77D|nr:MAG: hypothetical protein KVP17_004759 [Porospora cf. gigantea B]
MGAYLSKPLKVKDSESSSDERATYAVTGMQGWRQYMEDAHVAVPDLALPSFPEGVSLYGVFDGHGGPAVSMWVSRHIASVLAANLQSVTVPQEKSRLTCAGDFNGTYGNKEVLDLCEAVQSSFLRLDDEMSASDAHTELKHLQSVIEADRTRVMKENDINPSVQQPLLKALLQGKRKIDMHEEDGKKYITVSAMEDEDSDEEESADDMKDYEVDMNEDPNASTAWDPEGCGCTAVVVAHVRGTSPCLVVANAGDSRAVASRKGEAVALTMDHKPMQSRELARIKAAGGTVNCGRVDGNLNLSRSLGDLFYKKDAAIPAREQRISAYPDVTVTPLQKDDDFVILACDGIWDCQSNQDAVNFVRSRLTEYRKEKPAPADHEILTRICEEMCDACVADTPFETEGGVGCDNMTMMVVLLNHENDDGRGKEVFYYGTPSECEEYVRVSSELE